MWLNVGLMQLNMVNRVWSQGEIITSTVKLNQCQFYQMCTSSQAGRHVMQEKAWTVWVEGWVWRPTDILTFDSCNTPKLESVEFETLFRPNKSNRKICRGKCICESWRSTDAVCVYILKVWTHFVFRRINCSESMFHLFEVLSLLTVKNMFHFVL